MARNRAAHPTNPARRRFAAVVLGVVGIAGLSIASAAQLTIGSSTLGVGATIVSTCQGPGTITTSFPTAWNTTVTPAAYRVTAVTLSGVNATCVGKAYRIQMLNGSGVAVGTEIVSTVPALVGGAFTTATITAASQPLGLDVAGVSIVIQG